MVKYKDFLGEEVEFISSSEVKKGVVCDVYDFVKNKISKDLGIVFVEQGYFTPKQKVLKGDVTIEGIISGEADFILNGVKYPCSGDNKNTFKLKKGDTMQWFAKTNLEFYKICYPPYEDGRFQNL